MWRLVKKSKFYEKMSWTLKFPNIGKPAAASNHSKGRIMDKEKNRGSNLLCTTEIFEF
jgi:hypothetical protein